MAASRLAIERAANPSRPAKVSAVKRVEIGHVEKQGVVDQQLDPLLTETLDVHRGTRTEVGDALDPLTGAVEVGAERVALVGQSDQRAAADRAGGREVPRRLPPPPQASGRWPTTSGITSPAFRTTTVSPGRTSFARTWSSLWRVANDDRRAADEHRARAPRTASPFPFGRSRPRCRGAPVDAPPAGTCRRSPIAAPGRWRPADAAGRGRRP